VPKGIGHSMTNVGKETGTPWKPKSQKEYDQLNKKWGIVYK
jgi:hypothetical protein